MRAAQIEEEMGLSEPVQHGVDRAVTLLSSLVSDGHVIHGSSAVNHRPDEASSSIHD
jgi:hypothetical protein